MTQKPNTYRSLDGLRAYSALCIVIMHVLANGGYKISGFVFETFIPSFAHLVFLFMTVSAFSMCCGYYKKILNNEIDLNTFYGKRYRKILPFFALLCAFDFIISPSVDSIYEIFANLTLCFGFLPNANISVIGVGWFLGLIFVFYAIFPFFCYLLANKKRAWFTFICAVIFNILCQIKFEAGRANIIYSAMFFVAGGLLFLYKDIIEKIAQKNKIILVIMLLLCIGAGVGYYFSNLNIYLMLLFCVLALAYATVSKSFLLQNRFTKFISGISMEIYLSHMIIYRIIEKLKLTQLFDSDILSYVVTSAATIIGTVVFAWIAQYLINKTMAFITEKLNKKETN